MISKNVLRIIDCINSEDLSELKRAIYGFTDYTNIDFPGDASNSQTIEKLEENYYYALSILLNSKDFEYFKRLLYYSDKLDIFFDVRKIPNRFELLAETHRNGIRSGQINELFEVMKFFNDNNLYERDLSEEELKFVSQFRKKTLILSNFQDLFGGISNSLIYYVFKDMADNVFSFFKEYFKSGNFQGEELRNYASKEFMVRFFNRYSMYGLRVENLGTIENFIEYFKKVYEKISINKSEKDLKIIEFKYGNRTHLVSTSNILKNMDNILNWKGNYNFYSLSMVLLGGLGPQGHGFTYSTPKGEVVEICSDRKESEAIIIKFKEFLKQQFLEKLKRKLIEISIDTNTIVKMIEFLSETLNSNEIINILSIDTLMNKIHGFLLGIQNELKIEEENIQYLEEQISNAISIIISPIDLIDQFKCRMDFVEEGKITSEEVAKLTSLQNKSHYDLLRERFFFQNQIKWFYKLYSEELLRLSDKKK